MAARFFLKKIVLHNTLEDWSLELRIIQILSGIAVLAGLASGPSTLEIAQASQPPFNWGDLPFTFIGSLVGVFLVIGFQILLGKQGPARFASWFFGLVGIYVASSGVSAAVVAQLGAGINPGALFFLSTGVGMTIGSLLAGAAYRAKFLS